jgi:hypothetical protein
MLTTDYLRKSLSNVLVIKCQIDLPLPGIFNVELEMIRLFLALSKALHGRGTLPGQRRADLQSRQGRNHLNTRATSFDSREVVQQTVTEDTKDCSVVTWNTGQQSSYLLVRLWSHVQAKVMRKTQASFPEGLTHQLLVPNAPTHTPQTPFMNSSRMELVTAPVYWFSRLTRPK